MTATSHTLEISEIDAIAQLLLWDQSYNDQSDMVRTTQRGEYIKYRQYMREKYGR